MKRLFINQISERDQVDEIFLVQSKIQAMAKNGKPYLTLRLMDRTGAVEGRIWDRVDEISARFQRDDFVRVTGKASVYMGKMQLIIQRLDYVDQREVEIGDFLPTAKRPQTEMFENLQGIVDGLTDPDLKMLMAKFLEDADFVNDYTRAPAAKAMHHVYLGGLLEHALAVAALAEDVSRRYPAVDRDLLLVGALLHDVGKVAELKYERSFEYTDAGKLLGHINIGVEMVDEKIRSIDGFPPEKAILIKHLLLSHHGQYDYGSPKRPKTLEAVVLNFLDDLDSKINGVLTHIEKEPDSSSAWTQYHRLYDRYFFKGFTQGETAGETAEESQELPPSDQAGPTETVKPSTERKNTRGQTGHPQGQFSNTLGDQLKGKNLNLSVSSKEDVTNE